MRINHEMPQTSGVVQSADDPTRSARDAGLRYIEDYIPGITRRRRGKGFEYRGTAGKLVRDKETLRRIKRLAIPPAWTDVWICPHQNCHLQATERDARGRKQYRYHSHWWEVRDQEKFGRMIDFGHALPQIRRRVARDLKRKKLNREKALATVVRLRSKRRSSASVTKNTHARTNRLVSQPCGIGTLAFGEERSVSVSVESWARNTK